MKAVSIPKNSLIVSSSLNYLIIKRSVFSKCLFVLLLAGVAIFTSSFQNESILPNSRNLLTKSVPFKGKEVFFIQESTGTGVASHIGRFTIVEQNDLEGFPVITGTATITAANGDEIYATHSGLVQPLGDGTAEVSGEFTITGGTGRFAGATGSFELQGSANFALGTVTATFEGTINY